MRSNLIFESDRLEFRLWDQHSLEALVAINADPTAMRYFPDLPSREKTISFTERMNQLYEDKKYCYFPVFLKAETQCIGFIGMATQLYPAERAPYVDIGWRLDKAYWGKGLATEGAKRVLQYAFELLQLPKLSAIAVEKNVPSIRVMEKIGMHYVYSFKHPQMAGHKELETCVLYEISSPSA